MGTDDRSSHVTHDLTYARSAADTDLTALVHQVKADARKANRPATVVDVLRVVTAAVGPIGIETLIWVTKYATGLGDLAMAERAHAAGHPIAKQSIAAIAAGKFEGFPARKVLIALSEALAVPTSGIRDAFSVSLGLHSYAPSTINDDVVTIVSTTELSPAQVEHVRAQVRRVAGAKLDELRRQASQTVNENHADRNPTGG